MKKFIWLVLLVLAAITFASIGGFFHQAEAPPVIATTRVETAQRQATESKQVNLAPQVSAEKLFAHIQNLNFTRYTDGERSRTRSYITSELKKLGWKPKLERFAEGVNVFAQRQGTDKKAGAILVGAHYDTVSISPGADDNASGVAVILEIARILGSVPTPRTLQLAFFDKEEEGLLGSKAFATKPAHLKNLHGAIVMDMVGYACYTAGCQKYPATLPVTPPSDKGDFLVAVGDTEHLPLLGAFQNSFWVADTEKDKQTNGQSELQNLPSVLTLPIPMKGLLTPDTLRSDHAPFWYQGVGAILVTDTANLRTPHYHQASDTPPTIDRPFFQGAAQIVVNATNNLLKSNNQ